MPADYKPRKKRNQKKSLPGYLWLLSGLAIGLFIAFIVYLDKQPASSTSFKTAIGQELKKLKQTSKSQHLKTLKNQHAEKTGNTEKQVPKYNFYTLLQGMKVLIPEAETRPPGLKNKRPRQNKKTQPLSATTKSYFLQVGSFQNLNDAEKLKARLAFLGLQAGIQHITVNNRPWHRVRTGPYHNPKQLYRNQKMLQQHNINSISIELK